MGQQHNKVVNKQVVMTFIIITCPVLIFVWSYITPNPEVVNTSNPPRFNRITFLKRIFPLIFICMARRPSQPTHLKNFNWLLRFWMFPMMSRAKNPVYKATNYTELKSFNPQWSISKQHATAHRVFSNFNICLGRSSADNYQSTRTRWFTAPLSYQLNVWANMHRARISDKSCRPASSKNRESNNKTP